MRAGIIAAGKGERLAREGVSIPKPLIEVGGEPLISRVIRAAVSVGATSIACIINGLMPELEHYLSSHHWPVPLNLVKKTTDNSMESLFCLAPFLADEPFLLFTVDAVFAFKSLERFLVRARSLPEPQGVFALTRFIDDEKPLWVSIDSDRRVQAMGDAARGSPYVTAGFYYLDPRIFDLIDSAGARSVDSLRKFLGLLLENNYALYGIPVSKTVDVDHPGDIEEAERLIRKAEKGDRR